MTSAVTVPLTCEAALSAWFEESAKRAVRREGPYPHGVSNTDAYRSAWAAREPEVQALRDALVDAKRMIDEWAMIEPAEAADDPTSAYAWLQKYGCLAASADNKHINEADPQCGSLAGAHTAAVASGSRNPAVTERDESASPHGEVRCEDCHAPYGKDGWCDVVVPNEIWNQLDAHLLCFRCMTKRIEARGLTDVPVIVASGPYVDANEKWRLIGWEHGHAVADEDRIDATRYRHLRAERAAELGCDPAELDARLDAAIRDAGK